MSAALILRVSSATFEELKTKMAAAGVVSLLGLKNGAELLDLRGIAVMEDPDEATPPARERLELV